MPASAHVKLVRRKSSIAPYHRNNYVPPQKEKVGDAAHRMRNRGTVLKVKVVAAPQNYDEEGRVAVTNVPSKDDVDTGIYNKPTGVDEVATRIPVVAAAVTGFSDDSTIGEESVTSRQPDEINPFAEKVKEEDEVIMDEPHDGALDEDCTNSELNNDEDIA